MGHSSGGTDDQGIPQHKAITYADTTSSLVREQSESLFLQLKQVVGEIPVSDDASGIAMRLGLVGGAHYVSEAVLQDQVRTKALLLFWAHQGTNGRSMRVSESSTV